MSKYKKTVTPNTGLAKTMSMHAATKYPELSSTKKLFIPGQENEESAEESPVLAEEVNFDELERLTREYNESIGIIEDRYATLTPMSGVIVRMERREVVKSAGGIWQPDYIEIAVGTKSGQWVKEVVRATYQFKRVGVVVSCAPHYKDMLSVGSRIMVRKEVVTPVKRTIDHPEDLPMAFMHPDYVGALPPSSPSSPDFGYFMLEDPRSQIDVIISRPKKQV